MTYRWEGRDGHGELTLVHVPGTVTSPYTFGESPESIPVVVRDFFIATVPVTQALWHHIMPSHDTALRSGADLPVTNISWDELHLPDGFLHRMNEGVAGAALREQGGQDLTLRLPSETEWEYAARGGPHWQDGFRYSGSDDIDAVAWYDRRHGDWTRPVAGKAPNQLGIHDMSGNVWEWCEDTFVDDLDVIPRDGTAYVGTGDERVLRGGCFHNWAVHCTVSKRYSIARDFHDGCIGLRLVLGELAHPRAASSLFHATNARS